MKALLALLLVIPLSAQAAPAKAAKKPKRTLQTHIDFALKHGMDREVGAKSAAALKLAPGMKAKAFRYKSKDTPDGREHAFFLVLGEGKLPAKVLWHVTKVSLVGEAKHVDGQYFLMSTAGSLERAARGVGMAGEVVISPLDPSTEETRKLFAAERDFFLTRAWTVQVSTR